MMSAESGLSAFPDGDNIFHWTGTISGGAGTVRLHAQAQSHDPHRARPPSARAQPATARLGLRSRAQPTNHNALCNMRAGNTPHDHDRAATKPWWWWWWW